uniref:response regulator n=1 Tax=Flavobacterium sp. ACAM 123 TaxID=1189620 RepID=UPI0012FAE5AE
MKKILLIEDNRMLRENTTEFLIGEGFEVFSAKDGLEGVHQTLQHLPDLILCDISMPNMNGYDFYKTIQQIKTTSTIPLVFLSAKTENEDVRTGMQLGADDYIMKPFDLFELLKVIKTRLDKQNKIKQYHDEKFYALIKHPNLGMFLYQNGSFLYYNKTILSIFGYTEEVFSSMTLKNLIGENTSNQVQVLNEIDRCLKDTSNSITINFLAFHENGSKMKVKLVGTAINYKGVPSIVGNMIRLHDHRESTIQDFNTAIDFKLSKREREVLELICKGKSTLKIAEQLFLSQRTIDSHRANLLSKTNCKNSAELIIYAIKKALVS